MKCNYCGADNKEESKFCKSCGAELTESKKITKKEENIEEKSDVKQQVKMESTNKVTDGKATASLVLGICGFIIFCLSLPLSIIGLILGIKSKERSGKRTAGIVINAIVLGLAVIALVCMILFGTAITSVFDEYRYGNSKDFFDTLEEQIEKIDEIDDDYDNNKSREMPNEVKELNDTKIIGDDYYGYVKVPSNWIEFKDIDGNTTLQYTDIGDMGYIITLNTYEEDISSYQAAINISSHIKEEGDEASYKYTKIAKYWGYKVEAKYSDGTYMDAYLFKADDNKLHYVSIEGPDNENDNFDIPNTFSMIKE